MPHHTSHIQLQGLLDCLIMFEDDREGCVATAESIGRSSPLGAAAAASELYTLSAAGDPSSSGGRFHCQSTDVSRRAVLDVAAWLLRAAELSGKSVSLQSLSPAVLSNLRQRTTSGAGAVWEAQIDPQQASVAFRLHEATSVAWLPIYLRPCLQFQHPQDNPGPRQGSPTLGLMVCLSQFLD